MAALLSYFLYADHMNRAADLGERAQMMTTAENQLASNSKLTDALLADLKAQQANYLTQTALLQGINNHMGDANEMMAPVPALREEEIAATREISDHLKAFTVGVVSCHDDQNLKLDKIIEYTKPDGG